MHLQQQEQSPSGTLPDAQQLCHAPPANPLVSRLVHYALHQQLTRADQLNLRMADIDWPEAVKSSSHLFSPCSRWLAILSQPLPEAPRFLRLYGWEQGVWQQQILAPDSPEHVVICRFRATPPDTLIVAHSLDVLAWRRVPGTRDWHGSAVWSVPGSHTVRTIRSLDTMDNGDLVILACEEQAGPKVLIQFLLHSQSDKGWTPVATATYTGLALCWISQEQSCQLAVRESSRSAGHDHFINQVHVWHKVRTADNQETWENQTTVLSCHDASIQELACSPGGHYLVGLLSNDSICLWQRDAQQQLVQQLTLPGYRLPTQVDFYRLAPFNRAATQLAVPCSLRHIQLFYRDSNDHWRYGQQLEAPAVPNVPADDRLRDIMLSPSGRTLVRATRWQLDIWHRDTAGHWTCQVQRIRQENARFFPTVCLVEPGELVCTTVQDPELSLWVHGPDRLGQLVRKACMSVEAPISTSMAVSPDGLSLLLGTMTQPPTLMQFESGNSETRNRAEQAQTPVPEPVPNRHGCRPY